MPEEFKICKVTTVFNSFCPIASLAIIASVTASVEPVVITVPVLSGKVIFLSAVGSATNNDVSNESSVAPSNAIILPCANTIEEPKIVNPVDEVILLVPVGFIVVTPATNALLTVKLSLIIIVVESVDLIVLPDISIVPNVCVAPEPVILVPVIAPALSVPVVVKFSLPNDIAPVSYTHLTLPTSCCV